MAKRRHRIIEKLRKEFPHLTWTYEWPSRWISSEGWAIQAYSAGYDEPGERFYTQYRREDTQQVWYPGLGFFF